MDIKHEKKLVKKAKQSIQAFDELYEYYLPKIFGYILNRTANKAVAEDITSKTFIKAMTKIKQFKYKGYTFGAWLYRIAHNTLVDHFRKNKNISLADMSRFEKEDDSANGAQKDERQEIILEALRKIPRQYQEVLSLKFFEGLSNREMADILGCKKATLAVKLHRSLKAFQKVLKKKKYLDKLNIENKDE